MSGIVSEDEKTVVNFGAGSHVTSNTESEHLTFNRPAPGGRRMPNPAGGSATASVGTLSGLTPVAKAQPSMEPWESSIGVQGYENPLNPLLAIAQPLLNQMCFLNQVVEAKNLSAYRAELVQALQQFECECGQHELSEEVVIYSRYVLCTALDELVNKTPWKGKGEWAQNSLLAQYHGETGGGEKFFDLLNHLMMHPAKHITILEMMFVIMNLGFEGKYHLEQQGYLQLEKIKDNLFQTIRLQRGEPEPTLSLHWQGNTDKRNPLMRYIPAWVFMAVTGLLFVSMFSGFKYLADDAGYSTLGNIQQLKNNTTQTESDANIRDTML